MGYASCLQTINLTACAWQVRRGCFVYDPFVGTGSLLVAAAALGATTLGADLDVRVVRDGKRGGDGQARSCPSLSGCRSQKLKPCM